MAKAGRKLAKAKEDERQAKENVKQSRGMGERVEAKQELRKATTARKTAEDTYRRSSR
jgi:hypothetical protein